MNRYIFVGAVEGSAHCLRSLLEMNINIVDIMCPDKESSQFNSDYFDLGLVARDYGKEAYYFKKIKDEEAHIRKMKPDIIFVLGLSQIVPKSILDIATIGCIGLHPSLLPKNRGRHPIIWAIANGLQKSGVTLFWMDEGVDTGDIWGQKEFSIEMTDDAVSIYEKVKKLSVEILKENVSSLEKGVYKRNAQDHTLANTWRKRSAKDGEIDWRMSSKRIYDLVRALTKPYVGAHCIYKNKEVKIWKASALKDVEEYENIEPGKVLSVEDDHFTVKTGDGLIKIINHEFEKLPRVGGYL